MNEEERQERIAQHIEWCRSERTRAKQALSDYENGMRWLRSSGDGEPRDVTEQHKERYKKIVEKMEQILEDYGAELE